MPESTSKRQLATAVGVSAVALGKLMRRDDWPVSRDAPWSDDDVREINAWRAAKLRPDRSRPNLDDDEPTSVSQQKDYWLTRKYKVQCLREEGQLVPLDDAIDSVRKMATTAQNRLRGLPAALAPRLAGLTAAEIQTELEKDIDAICADLSDPSSYLGSSAGMV